MAHAKNKKTYETEEEAIVAAGEMDTSGGFVGPEHLVFRGDDGYSVALVGPSIRAEYVREREAEGREFVGIVHSNNANHNFAIRFWRYDGQTRELFHSHWLAWNWASGAYEQTDDPYPGLRYE